ncbi:MAG TPA: hypothetical protein VL403_00455 [Candidatus Kryptonia bacterium]|nr:hypothetical protein [Candidatus Kryptonia bacterium]
MRDLTWWALPGLIVAGPLSIFLRAWHVEASWGTWLLFAPVAGFLLHQTVRWRFEAAANGFRSSERPALATIIERGNLGRGDDAGDFAYQVYELVFYEQRDWGPIRDHLHRCWHYVFWFRTISLACLIGGPIGVLALLSGAGRLIPLLYVAGLLAFASVLRQKAEQTLAALHLFDRGLVLSHWPLYQAKLTALATRDDS